MQNVLAPLAILVILFELYRLLRGFWLRCLLEKKKKAQRSRKPPVLRAKSERGCPYSREDKEKLVGYGTRGKQEAIQNLKCQACGEKFTVRRNTILYRLKGHSELVEKILWFLALRVDAFALEEVFGVREGTISTQLRWGGMQSRKLHERFMAELEPIHTGGRP
jgi:transposase-like protein